MSITATRGALTRAARDLQISWLQTKNFWNDAKAREFEEKYITPLPDALNSACSIIEELDQILTKIRRDCE